MKRSIILFTICITSLVYLPNVFASKTDQSTSEKKDISVSITNVHQINLDNTDIDSSGNWLYKRIWYERAQKVFDEIRLVVSQVTDLRIQFSNEVNAIGQKIDVFFETVPFSQGELDAQFKDMLSALDAEQRLIGDLSQEERDLQKSLKDAQPTIDQIEKDIKSIGQLDKKIDETLIQAFKTIEECRDFESKSWDDFKSIAKELDDKKARAFYYQMNNYKQNIDQKNDYLRSNLLPYLHNILVAKIESNIDKITKAVNDLKTKGVDLEKIMDKSLHDDVAQVKSREKEAVQIAVEKALQEEREKEKVTAEKAAKELEQAQEQSFNNVVHRYYEKTLGKIVNFFTWLTKPLTSFFRSYTYPVATYVSHILNMIKIYMQNLVHTMMGYFSMHAKEKIKNIISEKIASAEKSHDATSTSASEKQVNNTSTPAPVQNNSSDNKESNAADSNEKNSSAIPDIAPNPVPAPVPTPEKVEQTAQVPTPQPVPVPQPVATHSEEKDNVKVESIQEVENNTPSNKNFLHPGYTLFTTILDFIGTIIMSVYHCVLQFFKLILQFSAYVRS